MLSPCIVISRNVACVAPLVLFEMKVLLNIQGNANGSWTKGFGASYNSCHDPGQHIQPNKYLHIQYFTEILSNCCLLT